MTSQKELAVVLLALALLFAHAGGVTFPRWCLLLNAGALLLGALANWLEVGSRTNGPAP